MQMTLTGQLAKILVQWTMHMIPILYRGGVGRWFGKGGSIHL